MSEKQEEKFSLLESATGSFITRYILMLITPALVLASLLFVFSLFDVALEQTGDSDSLASEIFSIQTILPLGLFFYCGGILTIYLVRDNVWKETQDRREETVQLGIESEARTERALEAMLRQLGDDKKQQDDIEE